MTNIRYMGFGKSETVTSGVSASLKRTEIHPVLKELFKTSSFLQI